MNLSYIRFSLFLEFKMPRLKKFGKNKFKGNQFNSNRTNVNSSSPSNDRPALSPSEECRPSPTSLDNSSNTDLGLNTSSSEKKLYHVKLCGEDSDYLPDKNTNGNIIVDLGLLNVNLMSSVKCVRV